MLTFTGLRIVGGQTINLPLYDATLRDPYRLANVDGLGPPEVDVQITNALYTGGKYHGRRPQNREIVMLIDLNPDFSVNQTPADLRSAFYKSIAPASSTGGIQVQIMNEGAVIAFTNGYVKKVEINPFAKNPQVQLTIACLTPYFMYVNNIESTPEDLLNFMIDNIGDAPSGFEQVVTFTANTGGWSIAKDGSNERLYIDKSFLIGDELHVNTIAGSKDIYMVRDGVTTSLLSFLDPDSTWLQLTAGENHLSHITTDFTWNSFVYRPLFWGV